MPTAVADDLRAGVTDETAVVMAEAQARLLERTDTVDAIDAFLDDSSQGVRRDRLGRRPR